MLLIMLFCSALYAGPASADTGIGLHAITTANSGTFAEGSQLCLTYLIYNPFDTDVYASLSAEGEIAGLVTRLDGAVFVQKRTGHENGKEAKICFGRKGRLGTACEPGVYSGSVIAALATTSGQGNGGASAQPLELTVTCRPHYSAKIPLAIIAALGLALVLL